jgi:hypothetical protein
LLAHATRSVTGAFWSNNLKEQSEMATNNRGGNRAGNRGRGARNNNPEGRNQYSGIMGSARNNPLATAAAVGGAVAAGVFLWSRRNQISDQIGSLAEQISDWREGMQPEGSSSADDMSSGEGFVASSGPNRGGRRTQAEISQEALTLKEIGEAS